MACALASGAFRRELLSCQVDKLIYWRPIGPLGLIGYLLLVIGGTQESSGMKIGNETERNAAKFMYFLITNNQ